MQGQMLVPRLFSRSILSTLKLFIFAISASLLLTGCEGSTVIVNELDERDANEIIVFLTSYQVPGEKVAHVAATGSNAGTTWNVAVKTSDKMKALTLLNNNGLPRRRSQNLLALFQKQGLVSSELEEKIRYQSGLGEQIASTIRKIDGILDADVQISFPHDDAMPGQAKNPEPITASVYVKHQGVLDNPNSHLVLKIKQLVSSSIPGLNFDNVTVIADRAVFNDPLSLTLKNEPVIVSVWGIRVVRDYVLHLQLIFFCLVGGILLTVSGLFWITWKMSRIFSKIGGFKSLISPNPWTLPSEAPAAQEDPHANETPVDSHKA